MIKVIFWDFDGVIADSFNVKTDAFHEMYLPYGEEIAEKVRQHHLANGGVSRFEKFKLYQAEYLGEPTPIPQETINRLAQQFSDLVMNKVVNAPYINGVVDTLKKYSKCLDNYIISGTPTDEMREIIERRGLTSYFKGVYGSPDTKAVWTKRLMEEQGYQPNECIWIGDALSDYKAAKATDTFFILRRHEDNGELFADYHSYAIDDFTQFDEVFNQINQKVMKILLTSTSFMDTPGSHHDLLKSIDAEIDTMRGPVNEAALLPVIAQYDAVVCGDDEYTRKVLETGKAGCLRILSKYGIGLDKIDLKAAEELGIKVANTPGVNHVTVAEHAFTHILAFFKNYYEEVTYVREGKWKRLIQHEIYGKRLSIFGLGRIGKELAIRAKAFGLEVKVYDPFADKAFVAEHGLTLCENLDDLFNDSEIITLHSPLTEDTKHVLNAERFAKLKCCPLLVNTARAGLVDKEALIKALDNKLICGYVADVMWEEPIQADEPLLKYANVFITPHIGSRTYESVVRQGTAAVNNLINMIKKQ